MECNKHDFIEHEISGAVTRSLSEVPVTALLGPRQCGKSTLARHLLSETMHRTASEMHAQA